jgi:hypothetical protein
VEELDDLSLLVHVYEPFLASVIIKGLVLGRQRFYTGFFHQMGKYVALS